jgi:hypothetical protein
MVDMSEATRVFSHAVALEQNGKMKSIIACKGNIVYILNYDKTVLFRFELSRVAFQSELCFNADDYDSEDFREENGKIIFVTKGEGGYDREKICKAPNIDFKNTEVMFNKFWGYSEGAVAVVKFTSNDLKLLDESLSHVEFLSKDLQPMILQRDIFSGSVIKLEKKKFKGLDIDSDEITSDFGPVGMRTNDLIALFTFNPILDLFFLSQQYGCFIIEGKEYKMKAIVAKCLYDDLGSIEILNKEEEKNGGKISKNGSTEQEVDRNVEQSQESERPARRRRG